MELFVDPFVEFAFMRRALAGCIAISLGATPVGVFLLLRRMSLTGDAIAHAILPGAAVGYLIAGLSLSAMTLGGLTAGLAVALLSGYVTRVTRLKEDASLAAFYLLSLALGVAIVSTRGDNVELLHVLFGTVLSLNDEALVLLAAIATASTVTVAVLFRPLVMECVDPAFLRGVSGVSAVAHFGFLSLAVINLVAGFHALGTLMAVGVMILPAAAARFWTDGIGAMLALAFGIAAVGSVAGLLLSYHLGVPSGPAIVLALGGLYVASLAFGRRGSLLSHYVPPRRHLEA